MAIESKPESEMKVLVSPLCLTLCYPMDYVALEAPLSMEFSRLECRSGLPFPPPGDLPNPGIEPTFLMSPELAGKFFTTSTTWATRAVLNLA